MQAAHRQRIAPERLPYVAIYGPISADRERSLHLGAGFDSRCNDELHVPTSDNYCDTSYPDGPLCVPTCNDDATRTGLGFNGCGMLGFPNAHSI